MYTHGPARARVISTECPGQFSAWDLEVQNKHSEKIECIQTSCRPTCMKWRAVWSHCSSAPRQESPGFWLCGATTKSSDGTSCRLACVPFTSGTLIAHFPFVRGMGACGHLQLQSVMALTRLKGDSCLSCHLIPHPPAKESDGFINSTGIESLGRAWL